MTTTPTDTDYSQFQGKNVKIVRNLPEPDKNGDLSVEVEGQVQLVNVGNILIKPKGSVKFDMIPISEVEEIFIVASAVKKFKPSKLKPIEIGGVRRHLLERHGVTLEYANTTSEDDAKAWHDSLDHVASDLGHVHMTAEEVAAAAKKAAAPETAPTGTPEEY